MEGFNYYSERESVLLGFSYGNKSLIASPSTNPSTPRRSSDVDFNDVFGGPPRRSSVNEMRHSMSVDWSGEEEGERGGEKPVFGEDKRYQNKNKKNSNNDEFYDDIFGGEESRSLCSSSPARGRSLTPAPDPASSSALPLPFSLPAKLTNGVDLPTFGSPTRSRNHLNNINDGTVASNGLASSDFHLSRFSAKRKELRADLKPPYQPSLLSQEFSSDKETNMKQDISNSEASPSACNGQFHFSIYKWASKGVPLVMPLRTERTSRTKDKVKLERCSSAKDGIVSEIATENAVEYNGSFLSSINNRKKDVSTTSTASQKGAVSQRIVEQRVSAGAQTATNDVSGSSISCDARAGESSTPSTSEIGFSGKTEAESQTQKSKPLHSFFKETDEKQGYDEMIRRENEESKTKNTKKLSAIFDVTMNPKKEEGKVFFRDVGHSKATSQGFSRLGENMGKGSLNGKVKDFVRIFNQEAVKTPKADSKSRLQGSTFTQRDALRTKNEVSVVTAEEDEWKAAEGDPDQSKKENSAMETTNIPANNLSQQDDISASAIPDISSADIGDKDEPFHENFMIQVLAEDEGAVLQNHENLEIQVIDKKIQQWSKGKEGNIRSLLSTLQYVLWPECGWKAVPLVDIIEGNAVKRAYQRALLCLHPDKLQQKGAASHQKYTAEKVFDILQDLIDTLSEAVLRRLTGV